MTYRLTFEFNEHVDNTINWHHPVPFTLWFLIILLGVSLVIFSMMFKRLFKNIIMVYLAYKLQKKLKEVMGETSPEMTKQLQGSLRKLTWDVFTSSYIRFRPKDRKS